MLTIRLTLVIIKTTYLPYGDNFQIQRERERERDTMTSVTPCKRTYIYRLFNTVRN